jgi:hypothetical protein
MLQEFVQEVGSGSGWPGGLSSSFSCQITLTHDVPEGAALYVITGSNALAWFNTIVDDAGNSWTTVHSSPGPPWTMSSTVRCERPGGTPATARLLC